MPVFIKASGGGYVCDQISSLAAQVGLGGAGTVGLTWTNPSDVNFKGVVIRYKTGSYPISPTDGSLFYDSNDAVPATTLTKTGFTDGILYYFRVFSYCYEGATRVYNDQIAGAQVSATPLQPKGIQTYTSSGTFTIPVGVNSIDVFAVGGGGGGGGARGDSNNGYGAGGGGGGYTKTQKSIQVTPGQTVSFAIGAGGAPGTAPAGIGGRGGTSTVTVNGVTYSALGGYGGGNTTFYTQAGNGGSGGGNGGYTFDGKGYNGGSDGSNGGYRAGEEGIMATGQSATTRAFGEALNTLFAGGGGGGSISTYVTSTGGVGGAGGGGKGGQTYPSITNPVAGTGGTGGGGGGGYVSTSPSAGAVGGSGVVQIRWGY